MLQKTQIEPGSEHRGHGPEDNPRAGFFRSVRAGQRDEVPLVYVRPDGAGFSAMRLILANCFARPTQDGTLVDSAGLSKTPYFLAFPVERVMGLEPTTTSLAIRSNRIPKTCR